MSTKILRIKLKSAATFGRGDGLPGYVDREIEYDTDGFPYLRGRTLKGLLAESAENLVFAIDREEQKGWRETKNKLFGRPGRGVEERGIIHVSDARLPVDLRKLILASREKNPEIFSRDNILNSLTGIRRQTAINPDGGPEFGALRAMRVLLRGIILEAHLSFDGVLDKRDNAFLAATVLDFRHAGTGRNRGRGWLEADLLSDKYDAQTKEYFEDFMEAVR